MKTRFVSLLLSLFLLASNAANAEDNGWSGNINLLLGSKGMSEQDWLATSHGEVGILLDFGRAEWPVNIAIDMLRSRGEFSGYAYAPGPGIVYVEEEMLTREMNLGVRHYFEPGSNMHPYIGGGLALISLEVETNIGPGLLGYDEGKGGGIWLNGGIKWQLDAFNLGFDIRISAADVELDVGEFSGGGGHAGLLMGYHW